MTEEQRNEQTEVEADEVFDEAAVPATIGQPVIPRGMTEEQAEQARQQADAMVTKLLGSAGSGEMAVMDEVIGVGIEAQRLAADQLGHMKNRVADYMRDGGSGKDIATGLADLRRALNQINPHSSENVSWVDRLPRIPLLSGPRGPVKSLQRIALRYEPVSGHVAKIESRLREGRGMLVRDNVELRKLYEQVEAQQAIVQQAVYFGEALMYFLSNKLDEVDDEAKRYRLQDALHDVAQRVQDLRTMEEVHFQYFVSIEMTRQNNNRLGQAVERTLSLSTNVVTVGLAIQSAMVRQKAVMDATARTREYLGDVVMANAAAIKRHTEEIGDLYNSPVIALDKVTKAHDDLLDALNTASQLRAEGIANATENIAHLSELSQRIQRRVQGLEEAPESIRGQIEEASGQRETGEESNPPADINKAEHQ